MNIYSKKGFTLIELLLVISIVALLSSVVFAVITSSRERAKENALISFFIEVRSAMELYKNNIGHYPHGGGEVVILNWPEFYPPLDDESGTGYAQQVVSGDFDSVDFLSLLKVKDYVPSKLPKNSAVYIASNEPSTGWRNQGTIYVVCEGEERNAPIEDFDDSYALVVHYEASAGPLNSLKRALYAWDTGTGYLNVSDFSDMSPFFGGGSVGCMSI